MTKPKTESRATWHAQANLLTATDNPLNVPYDVALREAGLAAMFVTKYWEPSGARPGLNSVRARLPEAIAGEVTSLVGAVQEAQTELLLLVDPVVVDHGERARFVVNELESAIEFLLDDDVHEEADDKLARLKKFHSQDGERSSALAQSLRDYATLGQELKARLVAGDDTFDVHLLTEAKTLAKDLAAKPAAKESAGGTTATLLRNRLLHLMTDKVARIRKAASHVYRAHPEILREVTSSYERRRRAAARRAKAAAAAPAAKV